MDLSFRHLGVTFGGRALLDDVTVTLRPGRVTAILGPNGAGKSTLVKAAAALIPATTGAALLGGQRIVAMNPRTRARVIGYLPQDAVVHWNVPVSDVVALGRVPHRTPFAALSAQDHDAIMLAMAATETLPLADRPLQALSGGERARVLLARVLAGEPQWLLADEPLASLDPAHQIDILDKLRALAATGAGVVIVLHDLVQAGRAADDILLLKQGRVAAFGPPSDVLTVPLLRDVFDIDVSIVVGPTGRPICLPSGRSPR